MPQVSAPSIYDAAAQLVNLWGRKADLANGRPFAAFHDIHESALEIILAVAFGQSDHFDIIGNQLAAIEGMKSPGSPASMEEPFEFLRAPLQKELQAFLVVVDSLAVSMQSPI